MDVPQVVAAVALGSNLGDRSAHLQYALSKLETFIDHPKVSGFYETFPVGFRWPQSLFLNAAIVGGTDLSARQLLAVLLAIESDRGRERPFPGAARTLDPGFNLRRYRDNALSDNPVYLAGRSRGYEGLRKAGVPEE